MLYGRVRREELRRARLRWGGLLYSDVGFSGSVTPTRKRTGRTPFWVRCTSSATYVDFVEERVRGVWSRTGVEGSEVIENPYYSLEVQGPYEMFDLGDFTLEKGPTLRGCQLA